MRIQDDDTAEIVKGYSEGKEFPLDVRDIECGHKMAATVAAQVREAIRAGREDGLTISIRSSWRSFEEQKALHDAWVARAPMANPANQPGWSNHQDGTAVDLDFATADERERFAALAIAHGMTRPVHREPWHFLATPLPKESA